MEDTMYKEMYLILFRAMDDAIKNLEQQNYERAKELLIAAHQQAEDVFISADTD